MESRWEAVVKAAQGDCGQALHTQRAKGSQASASPLLVPLSVVAPGSKPCGAETRGLPAAWPGSGQLGPPRGLASSKQHPAFMGSWWPPSH